MGGQVGCPFLSEHLLAGGVYHLLQTLNGQLVIVAQSTDDVNASVL